MTITTTAAQAVRVAAAVGEELRLDRPATAEECRQYVITILRNIVLTSEKKIAVAALVPSTFDPT